MKRSTIKWAAGLVAAAIALAGCSGGTSSQPGTAGTAGTGTAAAQAPQAPQDLVLGVLAEPASWDPAQAHVGHLLQPYQAPYDTLLLREPDGKLAPMLATAWDYTDSNRTVLRLKLRNDVTFSDGAAFNAQAVKANLEHFKGANGRQVAQLGNFGSATVVDDYTIDITLTQADPAFTYFLSQAAGLMGSPAKLGSTDIADAPIGTGPYTLDPAQSVKGSQHVFTAREGYWNPDLQKWGTITLRVLPDVTARVNAVTGGQVDATLLDPATRDQAKAAKLTALEWPVDWSGLLLFDRDGAKVPAMGDVRVRQAINYAIDREALLKNVMMGGGDITSQVFGPDSGAYVKELDSYYTFDPEKARSLLAEAGYPKGFEMSAPLLPGVDVVNNYVVQQLADVGIKVKLQSVPAPEYVSIIGRGDYPIAWFQLFQGTAWVAANQMLVPKTLYNPFRTNNPEVAALLEGVRTAGDDPGEAGPALNRYIVENAWFAPFYRIKQNYVYNADKVKVEPQVQMAVPSIYNYEPAS